MSFAIPVKKGLNGGMKQINFINFFVFLQSYLYMCAFQIILEGLTNRE